MKIEFLYGDSHKVLEAPAGVYFVGLTAIYNGYHVSALDADAEDARFWRDEEIRLSEELTVILHYYSAPTLAEVAEEFAGFAGMKMLEIKNEAFYLFVTV